MSVTFMSAIEHSITITHGLTGYTFETDDDALPTKYGNVIQDHYQLRWTSKDIPITNSLVHFAANSVRMQMTGFIKPKNADVFVYDSPIAQPENYKIDAVMIFNGDNGTAATMRRQFMFHGSYFNRMD